MYYLYLYNVFCAVYTPPLPKPQEWQYLHFHSYSVIFREFSTSFSRKCNIANTLFRYWQNFKFSKIFDEKLKTAKFSRTYMSSLTLPSLAPAVPSVNDWLLAVNGHSQVISCPHIVSVAFIFWFVPPSTTCTKFSFTALSEMKLTGKTRYYTN